jgi:hypothetical protein
MGSRSFGGVSGLSDNTQAAASVLSTQAQLASRAEKEGAPKLNSMDPVHFRTFVKDCESYLARALHAQRIHVFVETKCQAALIAKLGYPLGTKLITRFDSQEGDARLLSEMQALVRKLQTPFETVAASHTMPPTPKLVAANILIAATNFVTAVTEDYDFPECLIAHKKKGYD